MKQTSLEDVFVMDGEFEKYDELDVVGNKNLSDSWRQLIDTKRTNSFGLQYLSMLKKNLLVGTKTGDYIAKVLVQSLIPSVFIGIVWYTFLKQLFENQSKDYRIPLNCTNIILTFGTMEYANFMVVTTSALFRLEELENKCSLFLMASGGSRNAYLLS